MNQKDKTEKIKDENGIDKRIIKLIKLIFDIKEIKKHLSFIDKNLEVYLFQKIQMIFILNLLIN